MQGLSTSYRQKEEEIKHILSYFKSFLSRSAAFPAAISPPSFRRIASRGENDKAPLPWQRLVLFSSACAGVKYYEQLA